VSSPAQARFQKKNRQILAIYLPGPPCDRAQRPIVATANDHDNVATRRGSLRLLGSVRREAGLKIGDIKMFIIEAAQICQLPGIEGSIHFLARASSRVHGSATAGGGALFVEGSVSTWPSVKRAFARPKCRKLIFPPLSLE